MDGGGAPTWPNSPDPLVFQNQASSAAGVARLQPPRGEKKRTATAAHRASGLSKASGPADAVGFWALWPIQGFWALWAWLFCGRPMYTTNPFHPLFLITAAKSPKPWLSPPLAASPPPPPPPPPHPPRVGSPRYSALRSFDHRRHIPPRPSAIGGRS